MVKAAAEGIGLQSLGRDLSLDHAVQLYADSSAAIGICRRTGIGRVRHLAVGQLWVQERLREGQFTLYKVHGPSNPADLRTKYNIKSSIRTHLDALGVRAESGRAQTAPRVSAEIRAWLAPSGKA